MTLKLLTTKCLLPVGSLVSSINDVCMAALVQADTYYIFSHVYISGNGAWAQGTEYKMADKIAAFNTLYGTKFELHEVPLVQNFE